MTDKSKKDDLDTVRVLTEALESFDDAARERIIRWAKERLGMKIAQSPVPPTESPDPAKPSGFGSPPESSGAQLPVANIKSFVAQKAPKNDSQFCAVVAYYYRFVAPEDQRKDTIGGNDIQDAARQGDWNRFSRPSQTLNNAFSAGYLDKSGYGKYKLNPVGENLVAMVLPGGGNETEAAARIKKPRTLAGAKKPKKKRAK